LVYLFALHYCASVLVVVFKILVGGVSVLITATRNGAATASSVPCACSSLNASVFLCLANAAAITSRNSSALGPSIVIVFILHIFRLPCVGG
jgi:hypothetical protein